MGSTRINLMFGALDFFFHFNARRRTICEPIRMNEDLEKRICVVHRFERSYMGPGRCEGHGSCGD